MKRRYRKLHRFKKKRSFFQIVFKNRFFWIGAFVLLLVIGISYIIFFTKYFQIEGIKISGNEKIAIQDFKILIESQIRKKIIFFPSQSIFLANLSEIRENLLQKFPLINEIILRRKFPKTLIVEIKERKPMAVFRHQDNYYFLDREGIIFEKTYPEIDLLKIENLTFQGDLELGKTVIKKDILVQILKIDSELKQGIKIPLAEAIITSGERLNVKTSENWEIYFNLAEDIDWQITELKLVLEQKIPLEKRGNLAYIDLRFTKVYYKYR